MPESVTCPVCSEKFDNEHGMLTHKSMKHGKVNKSCKICDENFKVQPCREDTAKYCSTECQHKSLKVERTTISCSFCEDKIKVRENKLKRHDKHFCDINCRKEYFKKKNHPMWKGGYRKLKGAKYGPKWQEWRDKIISRDSVCQMCDSEPEIKTVHHIKPVREFLNEGKEISDSHYEENLVLLCRSCHGKVDMRKINRERQKQILL